MKTLTILALMIILITGCAQSEKDSNKPAEKAANKAIKSAAALTADTVFTFDNEKTGELPAGWTQYFTGTGTKTDWKIVDDNGNKVLAQLSEENIEDHFNEIVYDELKLKNVELEVRIKGFKGEMDKGGGFVWRFIDKNNHYIVRENPEEDNVVLYKMENGVRTDLPLVDKGKTYGVKVPPLGLDWNTLKLIVKNDLFTVYLNNEELFQVKDTTFTKAGKIGLWTKADAVSYFDDFKVKKLK